MNRSKMIKWYYHWTERQRRPRRHRTSSMISSTITTSMPRKTSRFFSSRLCMAAVSLAFMGGFIVGILLPICSPPPALATSNSSPHLRTDSVSATAMLATSSTPPNDTQLLMWRDEHLDAVQRSNDLVNDPKMNKEETPRGDLSKLKLGFVSGLNLEVKNDEEGGGGGSGGRRTAESSNSISSEDSTFFSRKNHEIETNSSSSSSDGGVLLRMLLRTVDSPPPPPPSPPPSSSSSRSPSGQVTSSRREVQLEKITHRTRPVLFFDSSAAVTAGWPQITRPYPPLPSSTPHLRLHDGVQTTISTQRIQNNKTKLSDHSLKNNKTTTEINVARNLSTRATSEAISLATSGATLRETSGATAQHSEVSESLSLRSIVPKSLSKSTPTNKNTIENIVDGVFWSDSIEAILPIGFKEHDVVAWTQFSSNATVVKVVEGCGRMQNRLLVFDNGTKSCCRYRQNNDQIQGEIFSFYLSKLLDLRNLPPASLGLLYGRERQWTPVRGQLTLAQWNEQKPVVMTKFVDNLEAAFIPRHFRGDGPSEHRRLHPIREDLEGLDQSDLVELAQWSDLIIFDYLTANLDRVVNNMYNKQWNPDMMAAPAHNLAKEIQSGLLVFLDNESGLLHGYRLLDKYESYHKAMLESLCIFRRSTVEAIRRLLETGNVGQKLRSALNEAQPSMTEWLPPLPDKSVKILRQRLDKVNQQIVQCEMRFNYDHHSRTVLNENVVGGGAMERYDIPVTPYLISN